MVIRRYLPLELILECYRHLFPRFFFDNGSILGKPQWKDIEGITLVCKETREIVLSLWFHVLRISDLEDWKIILRRWKRLYQWTRVIHYSSTVYKTPRSLLESFTRLNSLRIDLPTTHVTGEGDFDFAAPEISQILHEGIPGTVIQHLEINGITWLDPFVMRHLAEGLPNLRTLRLKQPLVWCGLCNTIGAPSFEVIPGTIIYDDGTGLPDGYSRYLAPLRHLHTVKLTVACGEAGIAYDTLFSNAPRRGTNNISTPNFPALKIQTLDTSPIPRPAGLTGRRAVGWSGECESCMNQLLEDDTFRDSYLARREATQTLASATKGDAALYPNRPPSLRRVEWELLELSSNNWPGLLPNYVTGPSSMYLM